MWVDILITVQHRIPRLLHSAVISMWVSLQGVCGWICVCTCLSSHPLCVNVVRSTLTFHVCVMCATQHHEKYTSGNNKVKLQLRTEARSVNELSALGKSESVTSLQTMDTILTVHLYNYQTQEVLIQNVITFTFCVKACGNYLLISNFGTTGTHILFGVVFSPSGKSKFNTDSLLSSVLLFYISSRNIWLFVCSLLHYVHQLVAHCVFHWVQGWLQGRSQCS